MVAKKRCVRCGVEKPFNDFPHQKQKRHGRKTVCYQCRENAVKPEVIYWSGLESRRKYRASPKGQYANATQGIKRRGFRVEITLEQYTDLVQNSNNHCHYCGVELTRKSGAMDARTMDRKDNRIGYKINNIVWACRRCNLIKSDLLSEKEMLEIAAKYIKPKLADKLAMGF